MGDGLLPTHSAGPSGSGLNLGGTSPLLAGPHRYVSSSSGFSGTRAGNRGKLLLKRITRLPQMDFELAIWQLTYLCFAPRRAYRQTYYQRQTKNTWARDDPAVLVIISALLALAGLLWSVTYARYGAVMTLRTILSMVFVDFVLVGLVVATGLWAISNRFLTHSSHTHATEQHVEWNFCFDIHVNAFFPLFLELYFAQLVLAPVVTQSPWICLWVGNTLWLAALCHYVYVVYLGLNCLPFVIRSEMLLAPIPLFGILYVVSLLGFNVARWALHAYFGV